MSNRVGLGEPGSVRGRVFALPVFGAAPPLARAPELIAESEHRAFGEGESLLILTQNTTVFDPDSQPPALRALLVESGPGGATVRGPAAIVALGGRGVVRGLGLDREMIGLAEKAAEAAALVALLRRLAAVIAVFALVVLALTLSGAALPVRGAVVFGLLSMFGAQAWNAAAAADLRARLPASIAWCVDLSRARLREALGHGSPGEVIEAWGFWVAPQVQSELPLPSSAPQSRNQNQVRPFPHSVFEKSI